MNQNKFSFRLFALIVPFILLQVNTLAQDDKRFKVKSGSSITDVLSFQEMYRYPAFMKGVVFYKDGTSNEEIMNYNIVIAEMLFINSRKDTLVIDNRVGINHISISGDTFFVGDGYFEMLAGDNNIMLLMKRYVKLTDIKKEGAYGTNNSTGSIDNYTSISVGDNTSTYKMKVAQDMIYSFKTEYYFSNSDKEQQLTLARENNVIKMFPEKKDVIKKYIKDQSISFNKKEDLIQLTGFLQELKP
jgi:hypothetical protein